MAKSEKYEPFTTTNNNNEFAVAFPRGGSSSTVSKSNWNLEVLVFVEGGKPEYTEKNPRSRVENQQQTQPTYDAGSRNRTRATLVGGERSHHCAIPAPSPFEFLNFYFGAKNAWHGNSLVIRRVSQGRIIIVLF